MSLELNTNDSLTERLGNIFSAMNEARADFLESLNHPSENMGTDLLWKKYLRYKRLCAKELRKRGTDDYPIELED